MPERKPPARWRHDTDLTDAQCELITPLIPDVRAGRRPGKATSRELIDAVPCFLQAGSAWRLLPHDLPPWQTVYRYPRRWQEEGVWQHVHHALVLTERERCGREVSPSAAILDSQAVRTAGQKGARRATMRARRSPGAGGTS